MLKRSLAVLFAGAICLAAGTAIAEGDADKGEKVFRKCKACHQVGENAKNRVGPALNGVVGRNLGANPDYKYSKGLLAMKDKVWDEALLDAYLEKPKDVIKGTKMAFAGLKKEDERQDVIAYLKQFSN